MTEWGSTSHFENLTSDGGEVGGQSGASKHHLQ
jgi:hypothetical protein